MEAAEGASKYRDYEFCPEQAAYHKKIPSKPTLEFTDQKYVHLSRETESGLLGDEEHNNCHYNGTMPTRRKGREGFRVWVVQKEPIHTKRQQ